MKVIRKIRSAANRYINYIQIKRNNVEVEKNVKIYGKIQINNFGTCKIAGEVTIRSDFKSNVVGGYPCTKIYVDPGACLEINEKTGISNSVLYAANKITIGKNVNIGAGCLITDSDSHSIHFANRCLQEKDNDICTSPVTISDGAFIGANSIILKGVVIGERAVIGAGSVVTKSVPNDEIWGGNPAKFIKKIQEGQTH